MQVSTEPTSAEARRDSEVAFAGHAGIDLDLAIEPPRLETMREALRPWYRDIEWIGTGRSGVMVRGRPAAGANDWVAIKVAYPGLPPGSDAVQRFLREAAVGARLHHPNIASIWPIRREVGLMWFEMPFMSGSRLDRFMHNERHLTAARAVEILTELAGALDHAAEQGVAHGALRPSEIFIQPDGHCMLSGFMLDLTAESDIPALAPSALGDPAYMAPEQWADQPWVGPATDQYALAVLAAELIGEAERVTRGGDGVPLVVPLLIDQHHPLRPGLGLHVNAALLRALSRDPWRRFPTCQAFIAALGDPTRTAHPAPETHEQPRAPVARHRWWHVAAVAALLGAAALLVMLQSGALPR